MSLLPVEEAKALILAGVRPLAPERVPLPEALGRVLAVDLKAKRDQPPFSASAMDGYAVRTVDLATVPAELALVGTAAAGRGSRRRVGAGESVRIYTGAPVPEGADAVVIQEHVERKDRTVLVREPVSPGQYIRPRGLDFRRGEALLTPPRRLNPRDVGLAAAMGHAKLTVRRRPTVAILSTGDELVPPGQAPKPHQIVSSNSIALSGLIRLWGGKAVDLGIAPDELAATQAAIARADEADILITSGGASVGEHDFVRQALAGEGFRLGFWKIAMRPGKPLMFATRKRQRVLGLPGNPVSALVCALIFLKPLIEALLGLEPREDLVEARLGDALPANDQRQDYVRATLERGPGGDLTAIPFPVQDSSMQRVLAEADGLIVRPPFDQPRLAGGLVQVLRFHF